MIGINNKLDFIVNVYQIYNFDNRSKALL